MIMVSGGLFHYDMMKKMYCSLEYWNYIYLA